MIDIEDALLMRAESMICNDDSLFITDEAKFDKVVDLNIEFGVYRKADDSYFYPNKNLDVIRGTFQLFVMAAIQ